MQNPATYFLGDRALREPRIHGRLYHRSPLMERRKLEGGCVLFVVDFSPTNAGDRSTGNGVPTIADVGRKPSCPSSLPLLTAVANSNKPAEIASGWRDCPDCRTPLHMLNSDSAYDTNSEESTEWLEHGPVVLPTFDKD